MKSSGTRAPWGLLLEGVAGAARQRGRLGWPRKMEAHGTAAADVGALELVGGGGTTTGPSRGSIQEGLQKKLPFGSARRISSPWIVCARQNRRGSSAAPGWLDFGGDWPALKIRREGTGCGWNWIRRIPRWKRTGGGGWGMGQGS